MSKQPSHSGERPISDAPPDSGEKPFDPSHFGRHQFPDGLREELIKAEKPRIDPKFLQDTVPPNRKPVLTDPDPVVTTPRGGFVAPKPAGVAVDRDAKTLIATPVAKPAESVHDRDATTLIKVPTAKPVPRAKSTAPDSSSAPPVDTSRTDPTIILPGVRPKSDKRPLVIGIVAALLVLLIIALLVRPSAETVPTTATPTPQPAAADTTPASKPSTPTDVAPAVAAPDSIDKPPPALSEPVDSTPPSAADSPTKTQKPAPAAKLHPSVKPAPTGAKTRPGFDPSKPWEED